MATHPGPPEMGHGWPEENTGAAGGGRFGKKEGLRKW